MPVSTSLRDRIVGANLTVPLYDGRELVYTNLDNAASTPALVAVRDEVNRMIAWYSSIHRGAGYKSQLASTWYEKARQQVLEFTGADPGYHCAVLANNTTDAINRLAEKFPRDNDQSVLISHAEHHANDLPWRERGRVVRVPVSPEGELDPADLDRALLHEGGKARLVSVTGASNVTGTLNPIHDLARVAHRHGVRIAVDAAQLAPHTPIRMAGSGEEDRIDFLFLSAHKMYAPYGGGALVGPREFFAKTCPSVRGGGAVRVVEPHAVDWSEPPERDEAGSPNVVGAVAMAAAMRELHAIGWDELETAERALTTRFLDGLAGIDGVQVYGHGAGRIDDRLGVVAFNLDGVDHALVAAILAYEHGIGVRNGCFCAQPFVLGLLGVDDARAAQIRQAIRSGDKSTMPGAVRVSFGMYTTGEDVDRVLAALEDIRANRITLDYAMDKSHGEYHPVDGMPDYGRVLEEWWKRPLDTTNGRG